MNELTAYKMYLLIYTSAFKYRLKWGDNVFFAGNQLTFIL